MKGISKVVCLLLIVFSTNVSAGWLSLFESALVGMFSGPLDSWVLKQFSGYQNAITKTVTTEIMLTVDGGCSSRNLYHLADTEMHMVMLRDPNGTFFKAWDRVTLEYACVEERTGYRSSYTVQYSVLSNGSYQVEYSSFRG